METLFALHAAIGIVFIAAGFIFDVIFIAGMKDFSNRSRSARALWKGYAYELVKNYLFVLGFMNVAIGLLGAASFYKEIMWTVFALLQAGSVLFITGGLWEAKIGPVMKWEPACYVLTAGLVSILLSLALEVYLLLP